MNIGHAEQAADALRFALLLDGKQVASVNGAVVLSAAVASDIQSALEDAQEAHLLLAEPRPLVGGATDAPVRDIRDSLRDLATLLRVSTDPGKVAACCDELAESCNVILRASVGAAAAPGEPDARQNVLEAAARACEDYAAEVRASNGTPSIKSARTYAAECCASAIRALPVGAVTATREPLTEQQAEAAEAEMRQLEADPGTTLHAMRLFMQCPMPCGHAAGNLLTCDRPPFGCVICGAPRQSEEDGR